MANEDEIEIRKPGGFALKFLRAIPEKDNFLNVDVLEEAFRKLEKEGVITYDIIDKEPQELPDDLAIFADIGWIEFSGDEQEVRLTPNGIESIDQMIMPLDAISQFEKVVQDIMNQN